MCGYIHGGTSQYLHEAAYFEAILARLTGELCLKGVKACVYSPKTARELINNEMKSGQDLRDHGKLICLHG